MAKIDWVQDRLERWAEWLCRSGGTSGGTLPMFRGDPVDMARPLLQYALDETECWKTGEDVNNLPAPLPETVVAYYLSGSMAAQDRLSISRAVLSQRIGKAHTLLAAAWLRVGSTDEQLPTGF